MCRIESLKSIRDEMDLSASLSHNSYPTHRPSIELSPLILFDLGIHLKPTSPATRDDEAAHSDHVLQCDDEANKHIELGFNVRS